MKKKTQIHLERWRGQKVKDNKDTESMSLQVYHQILEHLKTRSNDPFSQVKEKLKLDQKFFKREQWVGALNLGAGAPFTLSGDGCHQLYSEQTGPDDLKVHDSMKLS